MIWSSVAHAKKSSVAHAKMSFGTNVSPHPPCPSLVLPIPSQCLLTSWVCLSRLSHERRLIIRPPYYTHRLCTQVPSKAVMRHTEDGSRFQHGRGPRSQMVQARAARGGQREHGRGNQQWSATQAQARAARGG